MTDEEIFTPPQPDAPTARADIFRLDGNGYAVHEPLDGPTRSYAPTDDLSHLSADDRATIEALFATTGAAEAFTSYTAQGEALEATFVPTREAVVKKECQRRIFAVADEFCQMNMTGAAAAGAFTEAQQTTYANAVTWIGQMRGTCAALISGGGNERDDASWPACPPDVLALAAMF